MKVIWITNMPTIYRVNFLNELGKYCELTAVFERYNATGVKNKWRDSLAVNFKPIFINAIEFGREGSFGLGLLNINFKQFDKVVVSSYSSPAEMLAISKLKIQGIRYYLEVDGGFIKPDIIIKKLLKQFFISGADIYFSSSSFTNKYLIYYGASEDKIRKYHFTSLLDKDILPATPSSEDKVKIRKMLGLKQEKLLLAVGQFIHRKGFDILLKASAGFEKNVDIVFVGGDKTESYEKIIKDYDLNNIHFVAECPKDILARYYHAADVFVHPTREDIWGLVINEAMASGLPIITTDKCIAGLELVKDGVNGYVIPAENISALTDKVNYLLEHDYTRKKMGENSLRIIKDYSIETMAKDHYEILCGGENED